MTASETSINTSERGRLAGLDLLRLFAVLLVLGCHMEALPEGWDSPLRPLMREWIDNGARGVDLFFVLSGFLVSGLLFSEYRKRNEVSIARFYARRAWRIYPPFFVLVGVTLLHARYALNWTPPQEWVLAEVFFLQSYLQGLWNHTWTLAVEEHFYFVMPLLLAAMMWRNRGAANPFRAVPWFVGAVLVAGTAIRLMNWNVRTEFSYYTHIFHTHLRLDSLFFGTLVAYAYHFHAEAFRRIAHPLRFVLIVVGVALLFSRSFITMSIAYLATFGFTQFYVGSAALMIGVLMCEIPKNRAIAWLAMLGTYSYSIYLWHMTTMQWALPKMHGSVSWPLRQAIFIAAAFIIGLGMAKIVEAPVLKLRDRWHPSRTTGNAVVKLTAPTEAAPLQQAA